MMKKSVITTENLYQRLQSVDKFIKTSKEPVKGYHLVSDKKRNTKGLLNAILKQILVNNKILIHNGNKMGYIWNSKIPLTRKLSDAIYEMYLFEYKKIQAKAKNKQMKMERPNTIEATIKATTEKTNSEPNKLGLIRRFVKWIY